MAGTKEKEIRNATSLKKIIIIMLQTRRCPFVHLKTGKISNRPTDRIIGQELQSYGINISTERLSRTRYGKPEIKSKTVPFFNISHDKDDYIFAVTNIASVGVDLQSSFSEKRYKFAIESVFSAEEIRHMDNPALWWTIKEAIIKQEGRSLWLAYRHTLLPVMENFQEGCWQMFTQGTLNKQWIYAFRYQEKWGAVSLVSSEIPPSPKFVLQNQ